MLISSKISHLIHSYGTCGSNQAQWVLFQGFPGGDLAVLNIYAPNQPAACIQLWNDLVSCLPQSSRWIVCGDFNMVLNAQDNSNPQGHVACEAEYLAFLTLTSHLHIQDFYSYQDSVRFSWDNRHRVGFRTLKCLDRIYCFPSGSTVPSEHVKEYRILGDYALSDHLPISFLIEVQEIKTTGSRYKLNGAFFQDPTVVKDLAKLWLSFPSTLGFLGKLRRLVKWYKTYCLRKAKERRAEEANLRGHLSRAHGRLQVNPDDTNAQEELESAMDSPRSFDTWKLARQQTRTRVRWRAVGDRNS
jgi:hypothetical protein